ncbi:MAG: patatin-like phospholipase family protein [Pseudomonadota bacterium]
MYLPAALVAFLACLAVALPAVAQQALPVHPPTSAGPRVVVVLAGGGAKGFAHLAVLRRLERDNVKISKLVGTSMGAVIGGLYASGMSTDAIEKVIGSLDPARVALDQVARKDLSNRVRAYQQKYPITMEFGLKDGGLTFARGVSDGQRFLTLLQELTANVPPNGSFDDLKIPFRAVATRYRDGEIKVFDRGLLHLAIRASMAAPGVFAPVEIDDATYVDGGLVSNLPIDVALREGADVIVASYLGVKEPADVRLVEDNALSVANRMIDLLITQNERRSLALLRPQDILVNPQLAGIAFTDFSKAHQIIQVGEAAVSAQDAQFRQLAAAVAQPGTPPALSTPLYQPVPNFQQREIRIDRVRVTGNQDVPSDFVQRQFARLVGREYNAKEVGAQVDDLYTGGHFERINYQLQHIDGDRYELVVDVNEKPYGPNFFKTSLGLSSEFGGTNLFSIGMGYRRPWLTPSGLELGVDARGGTQTELAVRLFQPMGGDWGVNTYAVYSTNVLPIYRPDTMVAQKLAQSTLQTQELGANVSWNLNKVSNLKLGVVVNQSQLNIDTARTVVLRGDDGVNTAYTLPDLRLDFTGLKAQFTADSMDSPSFPTTGYFLNVAWDHSVSGTANASERINARWAHHFGPHVINLGANFGADYIGDCGTCIAPTVLYPLYLGGFQSMGAFKLGQFSGDRLAHVQATYMYQLVNGGVFREPTYIGLVAEAGDAWTHRNNSSIKYSGTVFLGLDSKIGDIYLGLAAGSGNNRNLFIQIGKRFSFW